MTLLLANRDGGSANEMGHLLTLSRALSGEVVEGFDVSANSSPNMTVNVAPGTALVPYGSGGGRYAYHVANDSSASVSIPTADGPNPRYDIIVLYVDRTIARDPNVANNSNGIVKLAVVSGVPASTPADPSNAAIQAAVGGDNPYIKLRRVLVPAAASQITTAQLLDDLRVLVTPANTTVTPSGWTDLKAGISLVATNINRSFDVLITGDQTGVLSRGMRLRIPRTGTVPTQSATFNGTSQFGSKPAPTGIAFTNNFTCEAWVKISNNPAANAAIISKYNGTTGFIFGIKATGQLWIYGASAAGTNDEVVSNYAVPQGRWVHVAASMDLAGNAYALYIDGQPAVTTTVLSNATAIVQNGSLELGSANAGNFKFAGQLSEVRIWSVIRTAQQIRDNANQPAAGNEANLVACFQLNGDLNDKTANSNNLTASGSLAATTVDNPFGTYAYAIVMSRPALSGGNTAVTLQTPEGHPIPNATLGVPSYSVAKEPQGFPLAPNRWEIVVFDPLQRLQTPPSQLTWYKPNNSGLAVTVPVGVWELFAKINHRVTASASTGVWTGATLSSTTNSETNPRLTTKFGADGASGTITAEGTGTGIDVIDQTAPTTFTALHFASGGGTLTTNCAFNATNGTPASIVVAKPALL